MGIRDFVLMLANTLVLPYLLRVNEVRDRAEVHPELISAARTQMALMLAARWHIGAFLRHSTQWHKSLGIAAGVRENRLRYDDAWPPWFKPVKAANGVVIQPLCSAGHCARKGPSCIIASAAMTAYA